MGLLDKFLGDTGENDCVAEVPDTTETLEKKANAPASELLVDGRIQRHTFTCGVRKQMRRLQILVALGVGASLVFGLFQMAYLEVVVERSVVKVLRDFGIDPKRTTSLQPKPDAVASMAVQP